MAYLPHYVEMGREGQSGIEDAAEHFGVSERTVESLLANSRMILDV
jgi:DNA-directed RNA polymerase specialized sigma24 family protein